MTTAHILGFPHIGPKRELKKAVENYWGGKLSLAELENAGKTIREQNWALQKSAGLNFVSVGDFAFYDHVLNTSLLLGVIPPRFSSSIDLNTYFCMARGMAPNGLNAAPCEMTKWFDTNYHYIVPEFSAAQKFKITDETLFARVNEALALGHAVKPVIVGPLTYLYLGKATASFDKLNLLDNLVNAYVEILSRFAEKKITWVQIDEPILTLDLDDEWKNAFKKVYEKLSRTSVKLLLTTYFGAVDHHIDLISQLPVSGLHIDLCQGKAQGDNIIAAFPKDRVLSLGVVNGRNIWRNDLSASLKLLSKAKEKFGENCWIASSCSLLHSPVDLDNETKLNPTIKNWMAFAKQKTQEVVTLATALNKGEKTCAEQLRASDEAQRNKASSSLIHNAAVQKRMTEITEAHATRSPFKTRKKIQAEKLQLPLLPTTTIGSFPQTDNIRLARSNFRAKKISEGQYRDAMQAEITMVVRAQEKLGLDVLVHGEPERNDMVEYFGELLNGFAFTENGWVQSYGSRCVKPPIIFGDVSRSKPMTVEWISYAQSQTKKFMKGMLTGPATIIAWSFVREDQPLSKTGLQIALALRDEVVDLEKAGISIIQIDEPAFREKVPLRHANRKEYFDWTEFCFRVSASGVKDETQIHTHMCYSDFNEIIDEITKLDADVITIESSRSSMELLEAFATFDYPNDIGPGVYDIHSPRIPDTQEMLDRILKILSVIPSDRVWVNPDCGLKTRKWDEVNESLSNMVNATLQARAVFFGRNQAHERLVVEEQV